MRDTQDGNVTEEKAIKNHLEQTYGVSFDLVSTALSIRSGMQ